MKIRKSMAAVLTAVSLVSSCALPASAGGRAGEAPGSAAVRTLEADAAAERGAGRTAFYDAKGALIKNKRIYKAGNSYYCINAKGVATKYTGVEAKAAKRLMTKGIRQNLQKAFRWSAMEFMTVAPPAATKEAEIAAYYGNKGFDLHRGDCYVQAYTFCYMARVLGKRAKVVRGYVMKADGLATHAWCEIRDQSGRVLVYDPNFNSEFSKKLGNPNAGFGFVYGAEKTLKYYSKSKKLLQ